VILTLTANPSFDRTVALRDPLQRGAVLRAESASEQPGGKGINISRAAVAAGIPTIAVIPARPDDRFVQEVRAAGIDCRPVPHAGSPRVNLTITEPGGTTTKINSPGTPVTAAELASLELALTGYAAQADWVVLAGSLPPGAPADWYSRLVSALAGTGARIAVDTSDEPLRALVAGLAVGRSASPHLMKPNGHELASFSGGDADDLESSPEKAAAAAGHLVEAGVEAVLATLGGNGAVLVTADGAWHATPPPTVVVSTVGAGDSSLFGYLLGEVRHLDPPSRLALAVAYGSAAAGLPGTTIPHPEQTRQDLVTVRPLNLTQGG
jgi:1-phosphofructokinase